ncbi:hypothetical protein IJT17_06010, partial [bacterium]|nr:hypothetical protein [bacterium]
MLSDCSFPANDEVVLRSGMLYWLCGCLAFAAIVGGVLANLWLGMERSVVGRGDIEGWLWRYCWWKQMLAAGCAHGFLTAVKVFFTSGAHPHVGSILDFALFSRPLESVFGFAAYYNAKVALILWLNCLACWFVLSRIWGANLYSWLGGLLFGVNSYVLHEIACGRCRQAIVFAIPLTVWQVYCSYRGGNEALGRNYSWLWAGLGLGLVYALYAPYGLMLSSFIVLWWSWGLFMEQAGARRLVWSKKCLLILAVGFVCYLPWGYPYLSSWSQGAAVKTVGAAWSWKTSFPSIPAKTEIKPLFPLDEEVLEAQTDGGQELQLFNAWRRWQNSLPLDAFYSINYPLSLPLLALLVVLAANGCSKMHPFMWTAGALLCLLCALGPFISVLSQNCESLAALGGYHCVYSWLYRWLPFASLVDPVRVLALFYMLLAVLICIRLCQLNLRFQAAAQVLAVLLAATHLWQLHTAKLLPLPVSHIDTAPIYYLLGDSEPTGLIEVPFAGYYLDLSQRVHGCASIGSGSSRWLPDCLSEAGGTVQRWGSAHFDEKNSFLMHLWSAQHGDSWGSYDDKDRQDLLKRGFSLLVLHERSCNILADINGENLYFWYFSNLQKELGDPLIDTFEPVYEGMPGRR